MARTEVLSRRRVWPLVGVMGLVGVSVVAWVMGSRVQSPSEAAARADPPEPSLVTAEVERRVLSATVIGRGDVRPAVATEVRAPGSVEGDPVVSGVSVAAGDEVLEGQRVVEVSGRPVFVLQGEVPMFRPLRPGMTGSDVGQLQAALNRLGCPAETDDVYGRATELCVAKLYADAGYDLVLGSETEESDLIGARQAVEDGQATLDIVQLAFEQARQGPSEFARAQAQTVLDAARRAYDDAVASANSTVAQTDAQVALAVAARDAVGSDPEATQAAVDAAQAELNAALATADEARRSGESAVIGADEEIRLAELAIVDLAATPDLAAEQMAVNQAVEARDRAQAALATIEAKSGATVPQGEVVFVPSIPARVESIAAGIGTLESGDAGGASPDQDSDGDGGTGRGSLLVLSSGGLQVRTAASLSDAGLLRAGMGVELLDEMSSQSVPGVLSLIADQPSVGADGTQGYPAVVDSVEPLPPEWSGRNVRVTFTAAATDGAVLVVPLAAVSSGADGLARVHRVGSEGDDPVSVPVQAGLSADGFVEVIPVEADALQPGDAVVVGVP